MGGTKPTYGQEKASHEMQKAETIQTRETIQNLGWRPLAQPAETG